MDDVVFIDGESPDDNFILLTDQTFQWRAIRCGGLSVQPSSGETKRMTFDVNAAPFPLGKYSG
jgi:hypothetical protein